MIISQELAFVKDRDPYEPEFLQSVMEVHNSLKVVLEQEPAYRKAKIFERLVEPERVIMFRVPWVDDQGEVQINRGFRVQWSSAIGPYKGGLRFHPSVNLSIMKFLAFEQTFKNALTTLPMGGGKGGSDFDPKGKSDGETMRFCQSFMLEMFRHIGANTDVPAGDVGVGAREIGYLYGMFKKIRNEFTGVLTGKGLSYGGSYIRPEATGYGNVYFSEEMAKAGGRSLNQAVCLVSGSGNVAQFTLEKLIHLGARPITASDSMGYIHVPGGFTLRMLEHLKKLKNVHRGRIQEMAENSPDIEYTEFSQPGVCGTQWQPKADCVFPSATQNEICAEDAQLMIKNGVWLVSEGSNMSTTIEGVEILQEGGVLYGPAKASNAGGVSTSGLEMSQNSMRYNWAADEVDMRLKNIMTSIHQTCLETAARYGRPGDYVLGSNAAGFNKVAEAMLAQGLI